MRTVRRPWSIASSEAAPFSIRRRPHGYANAGDGRLRRRRGSHPRAAIGRTRAQRTDYRRRRPTPLPRTSTATTAAGMDGARRQTHRLCTADANTASSLLSWDQGLSDRIHGACSIALPPRRLSGRGSAVAVFIFRFSAVIQPGRAHEQCFCLLICLPESGLPLRQFLRRRLPSFPENSQQHLLQGAFRSLRPCKAWHQDNPSAVGVLQLNASVLAFRARGLVRGSCSIHLSSRHPMQDLWRIDRNASAAVFSSGHICSMENRPWREKACMPCICEKAARIWSWSCWARARPLHGIGKR